MIDSIDELETKTYVFNEQDIEVTCLIVSDFSGNVVFRVNGELLPSMGAGDVSELALPGYFLRVNEVPGPDSVLFELETIGPAVPIWAGTRPYASIPVQWSCHIEEADGSIHHAEFLDLSGEPPMRRLALEMIECLGDEGPVLMYTSYEEGVIRNLIEMFPDLEPQLQAIINRLWDLYPVVKENYYHPKMLGSWSIKAVLPTMNPEMDYARLEGIKEGMGASDAFVEAISPDVSPERKADIEEQLRRYCRFDTEAMVEIVQYFMRAANR